MSQQFNATVNLTTEVCITCGVLFTMPCALLERRKKNEDYFYCPNGHRMYYPKEEDEVDLTEQNIELGEEIEKLEKRVRHWKRKAKRGKNG